MPESISRLARDRLQQLAATLATLRERVREAVASELGKAVGEALRDLLTAMLNRSVVRTGPEPESAPPATPYASRWDDDDEPDWHHEPEAPRYQPPAAVTPPPVDALRLGVGLARWLLHRRTPILAGLGVGIAAGLATFSSHPFVQTTLAVIAAVSELIAITESTVTIP